MYFEFMIIGLIGGLLGIFYRNCLKVEDMIFNPLYKKVLKPWALGSNRFLSFIAYPLGFCIYCSTTWITFFLCTLWLLNWESLPDWNIIVIGILAATGVQHLTVVCACRFLIYKHPDLDV